MGPGAAMAPIGTLLAVHESPADPSTPVRPNLRSVRLDPASFQPRDGTATIARWAMRSRLRAWHPAQPKKDEHDLGPWLLGCDQDLDRSHPRYLL
jgi:hypothetical protein